jgi:hypothetical protein
MQAFAAFLPLVEKMTAGNDGNTSTSSKYS